MKKRNNKKKKSFISVDTSQSSFNTNSETSICHESSVSEEQECSFFKVQLIKDDDKSFKWIKDTYLNIVLLHPSVVRLYNASKYIFIRGKESYTLCAVYPYRNIKKSYVVFPLDSLGFSHNEVVSLHSSDQNLLTALEVKVTLHNLPSLNKDLKNKILGRLSNQFICNDMKLKLNFSTSNYDFIISTICGESCVEDLHSSAIRDSKVSCSLNITNKLPIEHLDSPSQVTPSKLFNDSLEVQNISSQFSSMSVLENESASAEDLPATDFKEKLDFFSEIIKVPQYYCTSHNTTLTTDKEFVQDKVPFPKFADIRGLDKQLNFIQSFSNLVFKHNASDIGVLIFLGSSGTGKTMTMKALCNEYNASINELSWHNLYSRSLSEITKEITLTFQKANQSCPSIILADQFNYLCPLIKDSKSRLISEVLSECMKDCNSKTLVVVASSDSNYDDSVLHTSKTLVEVVNFTVPSSKDRANILTAMLKDKIHNLQSCDIEQCVLSSQGFTGKDLHDVLDQASTLSLLRTNEQFSCQMDAVLTFSDMKQAIVFRKPTITSSNIKIQKVCWTDIGGMDSVKEKLRKVIEWPLQYAENFKRFNITPPRGVLLYGPPGCSKTMIAKALATECNYNFLSKNASDLFNKYVGESERAVRNLFAQARAKSPCIIFLDEIDALVAERGSDSGGSGVGDRIVTTLLTEIDGIEVLQGVIIIAATNRPDMLDDALMRKGRFDHFIYVSLPDADAREKIIQIQMKKRLVVPTFDFHYLVARLEGYTGAEIVNICNEAALQLLMENPQCEDPFFTMEHFEKALQAIPSRITKEMIQFYEKFYSTHQKS